MYVRFETSTRDRASGRRTGLFRAAYALRARESLDAHETAQLTAVLEWFEQHLAVPAVLPGRAICWYRDGAHDFIQRMWAQARFVRACGSPIRLQQTRRPGRIAYADCHQVAAIPYADTFWENRRRGCIQPMSA